MHGIHDVQNEREAVVWYAKAARQNDTRAQFNLAVCFQDGIGVAADAHKAAK
jgi:TPR repeat protein